LKTFTEVCRESPNLFKIGQKSKVEQFTWRPRDILLLPATVHRHKTLSSTKTVPGCWSVRPSVPLATSACISATPTRRIYIKFHIGGVYEHVEKLRIWLKIGRNY
jgi:hypothetical protein